MENKLLTRKQAAEMLAVTPTTVKAWQKKGALKLAGSVNGRPRYDANEVANILKQKP